MTGTLLLGLCIGMAMVRRAEASAGWVAFITTDHRIGVARVDGNQRLIFDPAVESPASPLWLSDGEILFSGGVNRDYSLYVMRFPRGDVRQIVQPPAAVIPLTLRYHDRWLYFSGFRDSPRSIELYRADLITGQVSQLTNFAQFEGGVADYDLSPDGERLVVVVNLRRYQLPNQTYVMQADGSHPRRIDGGWILQSARWTEGGAGLVVTVYDSNGARLFQLDPDGNNLRVMPSITQTVTYFVIPPDGRQVVYHTTCGNGRLYCIYRVATDGGGVRQLTAADQNRQMPVVSSDGAWIAYVATVQGRASVWRMQADGSHQRRLATDTVIGSPGWSPPVNQKWNAGWLIGAATLLLCIGTGLPYSVAKRQGGQV